MPRWQLLAVLVGVLWVLDTWFFNSCGTAAISREANYVAQLINDWAQSISNRLADAASVFQNFAAANALNDWSR